MIGGWRRRREPGEERDVVRRELTGGELGDVLAAACGRIDRPLLGLSQPDRFLALREASDEAAAEGTEDREYDEVGHRLVDRV